MLHIKRANFVANIWKKTYTSQIEIQNIHERGWNTDGDIVWIDQPFPDEIADMLIKDNEEDEESDDDYESDVESEDDEDLSFKIHSE